MSYLAQIILLLMIAVSVVLVFQRLRIPGSLGYLLVGLIVGPATAGVRLDLPALSSIAEFRVAADPGARDDRKFRFPFAEVHAASDPRERHEREADDRGPCFHAAYPDRRDDGKRQDRLY